MKSAGNAVIPTFSTHWSHGLQGFLKRCYTPLPYFHQWVSHIKRVLAQTPTNGPRSLSQVKAGTHSPLLKGSHTTAHTAKHGAFRMGALLLPSERFTRFGNPAWPGVRTAYFAAFGAWSWVLPKNAESLRDSDALMCVAVPRRHGPAGLRDLFRFCRNCGLYIRRSWFSACARHGWYHYPRRALRVAETPDGRLSKRLVCRFLASPIYICERPCRIEKDRLRFR